MTGFLVSPNLLDKVNEYEHKGKLITAAENVLRKIHYHEVFGCFSCQNRILQPWCHLE